MARKKTRFAASAAAAAANNEGIDGETGGDGDETGDGNGANKRSEADAVEELKLTLMLRDVTGGAEGRAGLLVLLAEHASSGATVGDGVWVTGELGGSIAGHHLEFTPRLVEARWLAAHYQPSAMIDLSDGLAGDLGHLLNEANTGAELLESALPIRREARLRAVESEAAKPPLLAALTDGEDYELCFTLGQGQAVALLDQFRQEFPGTLLGCIGKIVEPLGLKIRQKTGIMEIATRGHVHFQ